MRVSQKFLTYVVVGDLVAALSISCKSNEEPKDNTHSNHPTAGEYKGTVGSANSSGTVTILGGGCNISGTAYDNSGNQQLNYDITITKWYSDNTSPDSIVRVGELGEATVTAPTDYTSFTVFYYNNGNINVSIQINGTQYSTHDMTRQ